MQYRYSTVVRNASELIVELRGDVGNKLKFKEMAKVADTGSSIGGDVIFVFPGQGSQYIQMSAGLYQNEPTYRKHLDACADVVDRIHKQRGVCAGGIDGSGGCSVLDVMFGSDASTFLRPSFVQPCIFMVEYCMARTLMEYGIVPLAMGGHSIGEYVAATLAGVFQLEDALELIVLRGIATENGAVEGSMLSISNIDQETLANILQEHSGVTVATHNAPGMYVLSGTPEHIQTLHASLTSKPPSEKTRIVLLRVNRAFHSPLMDGAAQKLEEFLENVEIKSPSIPVTSNVTGNWMGDECREPKYWGDHMRGTVRFVDNAKCLSQWSTAAIVEVGPGSTLCKLLTKCWAADVQDVNGVKDVKDVKDVVDEECTFWNRPTDDMRAVLLDRWLNEPFFADSHGEDDVDDVDDDDSANESWGGGSGNESDSGDVLERYQHLLDDKTLNGESADGGSSYEEFALSRSSLKKEKTFTLAKAKAKLYFRDHPSASPSAEYTEMLECDESRQMLECDESKASAFEYIDDNFVFKTMKKASLWENGAPVSAILYRRRPREGSFLMESYL